MAAAIGSGVVPAVTPVKIKVASIMLFFGAMAVWLIVVLVGFVYMLRSLHVPGERRRLSVGFTIASVFFPPLMTVPVILNVHDS